MLIIDGKIIIVHLRKTGGTSFCRGLIEALPPRRIDFYGYTAEGGERSTASRRAGGLWKHSTARQYFEMRGRPKRRDEIVIVVSARNHLERVASFYEYARRRNAVEPARYAWSQKLSFAEYLRSRHLNRDSLQDFATAADGTLLADCIVPFDAIAQRFEDLCRHLGAAGARLPHLNANRDAPRSYAEMYSPEDIRHVDRIFAEETAFLAAHPELLAQWPFVAA